MLGNRKSLLYKVYYNPENVSYIQHLSQTIITYQKKQVGCQF